MEERAAVTVEAAEVAAEVAAAVRLPIGWGIHVVRPGEMLWQIALRYGTTAGELIRANDIPNPDALTIGMRLRVPNGGATPESQSIKCPVRGAQFINDFGAPRPGGRTHAGIDLFAPRRTPVRAPVSGWVAAWVGDIGGRPGPRRR